jgi:aryl-alcohol dehydrogenase-like predicted oxidoreductase
MPRTKPKPRSVQKRPPPGRPIDVTLRKLGRTGLTVTPIGLGTWAIGGGGYEFGWGPQDDDRSIKAIRRAVDLGVNWVDTAPVYGLGHSEEVVRRAVAGLDPRPKIFTKVSIRWTADRRIVHSLKADSVREEVEASRKRLGTETIDLVQIHWPEPEPEIEEGWRTLAELKDRGSVRHIGVSNFDVPQMERAAAIAPVETLQPHYSLVEPSVEEEILPYAKAHRIGVIAYSPMGSGLLTGTMTAERVAHLPSDDWRRQYSEFQEPRLSRHLALARVLSEIGTRHAGRSAAEVAIAWTLANPAVTGAIVGARSSEQVEGFVGAMSLRLTTEDLDRIRTFRAEHP